MSNFYQSVIAGSSLFHSRAPVSSLDLLEPNTRRKVAAVVDELHAQGYTPLVLETYRSTELQEIYFQRGVTKLRHVGVHHYGLAADIVCMKNGKVDYNDTNFYRLLGVHAAAHDLIWGGDWGQPSIGHSFVDRDHVQYCSIADQGRLFLGTFYPDDGYDPYRNL